MGDFVIGLASPLWRFGVDRRRSYSVSRRRDDNVHPGRESA